MSDRRFVVRPVWKQAPELATITMGDNDVGIHALVLACILDLNLFAASCDQQIADTFPAAAKMYHSMPTWDKSDCE